MLCNVYDFDGTIYRGDSTIDFYIYCIKKYPSVLLSLPLTGLWFVKYKLRLCDKTKFKEAFYRFLRHVPNVENVLQDFWNTHINKIQPWYLQQQEKADIIISASPEFLLRPACKMLGIEKLIASEVDMLTGITRGKNCKGTEKVLRLHAKFPACEIGDFYSDSRSDAPLAALAQNRYYVTGECIRPW